MLKPKALFLGLMLVLVAGFALGGQAIPNWSAPATWTPTRASGAHTLSDVANPAPFVPVTPCRVADTRGNGFTGAYGPPSIGVNTQRTFVIVGQCGIPASAQAVSFNFAAANIGGLGDLRVFPDGGSTPLVSTINYNGSAPNVANAAVVPLGNTGGITVQADGVTIDLFFDVNGYYPNYSDANRMLTSSEYFGIEGGFNVFGIGGGVIYGKSFANLGAPSSGVRGVLDSGVLGTHAAGVRGEALATGGGFGGPKVHGVMGVISNTTNDGGGVYGVTSQNLAPIGNVIGVAGVRGEGGNGVIGLSSTNISDFGGVTGLMLNSTGSLGAFGSLGYTFAVAVQGFGNLSITGTKSFVEPHPTDASKMIDYVSLEGPEAGTYFRGTARFVNGMAVISVPDHFAMVTDEDGLTVQLTAVGSPANMYIVSEDLNQIVVRSNRDVKFHYQVNGVRTAFKDHQPIAENTVFSPRSPTQQMSGAFSDEQRRRLIANGTYNSDGSVNLETARAMGWAQAWEERAKAVQPASKAPDPQLKN